ncbi:MAG TPA: MFS transporter [Terriglobales bacterium]|nr:MFS transporter [Terriglobales bacterium]
MLASENTTASGRVAFTYPGFSYYLIARFFIVASLEMQSVAVGWQVYDITKRPMDLGFVGLAQFLPGIFLFLIAGHLADRLDRRKILLTCYGGMAACSALLFALAETRSQSVHLIYLVLVLLGVVRTINWPASRAILPQLVPDEHLPNAIAWNSIAFQSATILGPALGGVLYAFAHGPNSVYAISVISAVVAIFSFFKIHLRPRQRPREEISSKTMLAGFHYIWRKKVILGSISLDLFAVLLGGAVALLPVYAKEILRTGPWGLGLLRSAPGVGAGLMAILLAYRPLRRKVGVTMLWAVAAFGAFTIIFGLSHNLVLSMIALFFAGGADMISVVIRGTLIQLSTPDEMRGRVNAVDMLFIGASNEFGEFESGFTAQWLGTVPAVVLGGIGTLVVIVLWAWLFPDLRRAEGFADPEIVMAEATSRESPS